MPGGKGTKASTGCLSAEGESCQPCQYSVPGAQEGWVEAGPLWTLGEKKNPSKAITANPEPSFREPIESH